MPARPRLTPATRAVLAALGAEPAAWHHGYDLLTGTGLKSGSLYPILVRLADRGLLETAWETDTSPGRPPRHLYRLTGTGRTLATELATASSPQPTGRRRSEPGWQGA